MIFIKIVEDKNKWNDFLLSCKYQPFYQSWQTKLMYENLGEKVYPLGIYNENKLKGICLLVKKQAKRGSHLYCPHGPVLKNWNNEIYFRVLVKYLKELCIKEKTWFIKIAPYVKRNNKYKMLFNNLGFIKAPVHSLTEDTWVLDLSMSEEEILINMKKNTRNLIRKAIKEKVEVVQSVNLENLEKFYKIYIDTAQRHGFVTYDKSFIYNQFKPFLDTNDILLFLGKYNNEIIVASIIIFFGNEAIYYHGASIKKYPKIPVSYLVQWEAIKEAKKRKKRYYNFWGIYNGHKKQHPFKGITHFKKGFGGEIRELLPCRDLAVKKLYYLTYLFEIGRKIKRGF